MSNSHRFFFILVGLALLVACGGGGSGSGPDVAGGANPSTIEIAGQPQPAINQDEAYSFTPSVSNPDNSVPSFSVVNLPSWASFDAATGTLSGTPSDADVGTYSDIQITVTAASGTDSLDPFSITVTQMATGSVQVSWVSPTVNEDGSPLTDLAGFRIYHGTSEGDYPNVTVVNNPGLTTYMIENLSPNLYYFVATAYDTSGNESDRTDFVTATLQ